MPVKPQILKVTSVARSRLFHVEALELRFSNGVERSYERLATRGRGAVMIVPILANGDVVLIREYAAGLDEYPLTLPKGLIDPGENAEQAAHRELQEEAGFGSRKLERLKEMTSAPNYMGHRMTVLLARDLYPSQLEGDEPEPLDPVHWPLSELEALVQREDFSEGRAIAALYMARTRLELEAGSVSATD
ncbi:ADP compounds hydrolase NudE [Marinobacterium rhizophilum]|uniref:ADP compounds hydrolase NudE n=1 Tax=Marinobacterium rhizophilum TaxID=420402 RepID=A0ABY5HF47_9GAMM|nr:ADP compounds hydrolase NudE [Marinobacterium rhizophilum]UTW10981.1 ADP compounds hydrolase NudE [Marinobacterium rhizophilum]